MYTCRNIRRVSYVDRFFPAAQHNHGLWHFSLKFQSIFAFYVSLKVCALSRLYNNLHMETSKCQMPYSTWINLLRKSFFPSSTFSSALVGIFQLFYENKFRHFMKVNFELSASIIIILCEHTEPWELYSNYVMIIVGVLCVGVYVIMIVRKRHYFT